MTQINWIQIFNFTVEKGTILTARDRFEQMQSSAGNDRCEAVVAI